MYNCSYLGPNPDLVVITETLGNLQRGKFRKYEVNAFFSANSLLAEEAGCSDPREVRLLLQVSHR